MPDKVFISRLKLTDFRNYAAAALALDERHVVLTGDNGAGKTNLMEAVSLLSPGRGLRRAAYADVTRVHAPGGFSIFAELDGMDGTVEIGTGIDATDESSARKLRINGTPAKAVDELTDHLRVLWLTPAMDGLFTGGSSERRRFLDRLVLSLDPAHGRRASDFERAMRSRKEDGIVLVDYDKCIGCKYCAWACPYGARELDEERQVMTKCTLCVDRIYDEQLPQEDRKPACVKACPTGARLFGDVKDPDSEVSRAIRERGGYPLMPEWETNPANRYLPRRNMAAPAQGTPE